MCTSDKQRGEEKGGRQGIRDQEKVEEDRTREAEDRSRDGLQHS